MKKKKKKKSSKILFSFFRNTLFVFWVDVLSFLQEGDFVSPL